MRCSGRRSAPCNCWRHHQTVYGHVARTLPAAGKRCWSPRFFHLFGLASHCPEPASENLSPRRGRTLYNAAACVLHLCLSQDTNNALREPGRISKALLPSGVDSLNTALAQSFVPKSTEFSRFCRVSLNYFVGWRCILLRSCADFFGCATLFHTKEIHDFCRNWSSRSPP